MNHTSRKFKHFLQDNYDDMFALGTALIVLPIAFNLGRYKTYGTFFSYRTKRFYTIEHHFRTNEYLDYKDLPTSCKTDPCSCDVVEYCLWHEYN